jgi:hypothetical protein
MGGDSRSEDQECDNVFPGQVYGTSQRVVINEYETIMKWWLARETRKKLRREKGTKNS